MQKRFYQLHNLVRDSRHQMSDSIIVDLLVIKTIILSPDAAHMKSALRFSEKSNQTHDQTRRLHKTTPPGKVVSFQSPPIVPQRQLWKQNARWSWRWIRGCLTSSVTQRAMREAAPHARGVSKARQL
jgi:hypothetical protein